MKIETSTVTKLVLSELERLDPVTVILEDLGPNQGKMIIECYGKSWSTYWGGMGGTLMDFLARVSAEYIANRMWDHCQSQTLHDFEAFEVAAKRKVIDDRRKRLAHKDEARDAWDEIECRFPENFHEAHACGGFMRRVLVVLFGDEWWYAVPAKINPEYAYLIRVIEAVKTGVAEYAKGGEA